MPNAPQWWSHGSSQGARGSLSEWALTWTVQDGGRTAIGLMPADLAQCGAGQFFQPVLSGGLAAFVLGRQSVKAVGLWSLRRGTRQAGTASDIVPAGKTLHRVVHPVDAGAAAEHQQAQGEQQGAPAHGGASWSKGVVWVHHHASC